MAKAAAPATIVVDPIQAEANTFMLKGVTPLVMNRVNEKAKRQLLLPAPRKRTDAAKAQSVKHDPLYEYRASVYRTKGDSEATRLCFPAPAFHTAMCSAALDLATTKKAEIGRLTWVQGFRVNIFGIPQLHMGIVRNSDTNHTPDVRTLAILERWCCIIEVHHIKPKLNRTAIFNILAAAGLIAGIGDGRQERGKLNRGQFVLTDPSDVEFREIVAIGGREAQDAALQNPECYDEDTEELLAWFNEEVARRGTTLPSQEDDADEEEELEAEPA